jgi:hypothetical protein
MIRSITLSEANSRNLREKIPHCLICDAIFDAVTSGGEPSSVFQTTSVRKTEPGLTPLVAAPYVSYPLISLIIGNVL